MIKNLALAALAIFLSYTHAFAFTDLLPMLGDVPGYSASSAEGSRLNLPLGEVDIVSRTYTKQSAVLIATIYRGGGLQALEEHGISAGTVTKTEAFEAYTRSVTESGREKGYVFIYKDGSPLKLVLEYRGISSADALALIQELKPEQLYE